ncbi:hypothetical protein HYPP_00588 [Hyphomicrobium sp. ghe19]|nr:hypothetical protein HYPP_00588 [Hyphomicrobium sp. ghe19]
MRATTAQGHSIIGKFPPASMAERCSCSRLPMEEAMYARPPFTPDQFALCYRAYAAALLDIQNQPDEPNGAPLADSMCLMLALRVIEASANGVRDLSGLKRHALADLAQH